MAPEEDSEQQPQPAKKKDVHLGLVAAVFMGINLLLGAIAFAAWWLFKKRKKTVSAEAGAEAGAETGAEAS